MNAADTYYDQKDYLDDDMVKGRELDAQIAPLMETLFAAGDQMSAEVDVQTKALRVSELVAMEAANGRDFDWQTANVMNEARVATDGVEALLIAGTATEDALAKLEAPLQKAFDEATAHAAANPDATTALGNKPLWFNVEGPVSNLLAQIKEIRRDIGASQADPQAALGKLYDDYNSLVDTYNMMANLQ
jgi:hypothetical protein